MLVQKVCYPPDYLPFLFIEFLEIFFLPWKENCGNIYCSLNVHKENIADINVITDKRQRDTKGGVANP